MTRRTRPTYSSQNGSVIVNLAAADHGAAPAAVSGIATVYDPTDWTKSQPMVKGVTFFYNAASRNLTVTWPAGYKGTFRVFLWDARGELFTSFFVNAQ